MFAPESVLAWIVIGAIAGWLAGVILKGYGFGILGNIVVGIIGTVIAGMLAPRLGLTPPPWLATSSPRHSARSSCLG